ncbi:MAG: hypothetical protein IJA61_01440 [Clostridia bacterium]|nr:hypothetical protein [Clostridia bacterium]
MTKKYKVITAVIASALVLVIVGLAIGLVLVAQQVQMTNSVSVTYTANNVDCDVTVWAVHYLAPNDANEDMSFFIDTDFSFDPLAESTETAKIVQFETEDNGELKKVNSITHQIRAYENEGTENGTTYTSRTLTFDNVELQAVSNRTGSASVSSCVIYFFKITNKSYNVEINIAGSILEEDIEEANNISYGVGGVADMSTDGDMSLLSFDSAACPDFVQSDSEGIIAFCVFATDINADAELKANFSLNIYR